MLNISECREYLKKSSHKLSDDEVLILRDFFYTSAEILISNIKQLAKPVINIYIEMEGDFYIPEDFCISKSTLAKHIDQEYLIKWGLL